MSWSLYGRLIDPERPSWRCCRGRRIPTSYGNCPDAVGNLLGRIVQSPIFFYLVRSRNTGAPRTDLHIIGNDWVEVFVRLRRTAERSRASHSLVVRVFRSRNLVYLSHELFAARKLPKRWGVRPLLIIRIHRPDQRLAMQLYTKVIGLTDTRNRDPDLANLDQIDCP